MNKMSDYLLSRRSVIIRNMGEPGPSDAELKKILRAGMRVPDHGRLTPWRFIIISGLERETMGMILEEAYKKENPDPIAEQLDIERERFIRAPTVIAVISKTKPEHKIPEWEQILSSGAACQNILTSALSLGFAAQWVTEWYAYNEDVKRSLGLEERDRVAGFIYLGTKVEEPKERTRPAYDSIVSQWTGA